MAGHIVEKKGSSIKQGVFRNSVSGRFVTTVMSRSTFEKASSSANTVIREAVTKGARTPK